MKLDNSGQRAILLKIIDSIQFSGNLERLTQTVAELQALRAGVTQAEIEGVRSIKKEVK